MEGLDLEKGMDTEGGGLWPLFAVPAFLVAVFVVVFLVVGTGDSPPRVHTCTAQSKWEQSRVTPPLCPRR